MGYYLMPPDWFVWTKFEVMEYIWSLSLIAFSMSFPKVFRKMIEWNILGELYTGLFGLEIIIKVDFLKCTELAILMKLVTHLELVTKLLRWFHEIWLGPRVDELLYFLSVILVLENSGHSDWDYKGISSS